MAEEKEDKSHGGIFYRQLQFDLNHVTDVKRSQWHNGYYGWPTRRNQQSTYIEGHARRVEGGYRLPSICANSLGDRRVIPPATQKSCPHLPIRSRNQVTLPGSKLDVSVYPANATRRAHYSNNYNRKVDRMRRYSLLISERENRMNSLSQQNKEIYDKMVRLYGGGKNAVVTPLVSSNLEGNPTTELSDTGRCSADRWTLHTPSNLQTGGRFPRLTSGPWTPTSHSLDNVCGRKTCPFEKPGHNAGFGSSQIRQKKIGKVKLPKILDRHI